MWVRELCCFVKRSKNEDETACDRIGKIMERIEEKNEIKKVTKVASRIA